MLVLLMLGLGLVAGVALALADIGLDDVRAMLSLVIVVTGGTALVLYAWRRPASARELRASHAALRRPSTWGWTVGTAAAVFAAANAAQWAMADAGMDAVPTNLPVIEQGIAVAPWLVVLFGRLWAAGKPWLGIVLSSAVFALMHEVPGTTGNPLEVTVILWLLYGGMGAAFAWVYWRTGTLWAAFGAHALHNTASVLLLLG